MILVFCIYNEYEIDVIAIDFWKTDEEFTDPDLN